MARIVAFPGTPKLRLLSSCCAWCRMNQAHGNNAAAKREQDAGLVQPLARYHHWVTVPDWSSDTGALFVSGSIFVNTPAKSLILARNSRRS